MKAAAFLLCAALAVGLVGGCGGDGNSTQPITLSMEGAAPPAGTHAEPIADLLPLRILPDGTGLLAAGRFEPSGARFPGGLEVTWPLQAKRTAGESLWTVALADERRVWLATGDRATVEADGRHARGRVFHFSTLGISVTKPAREEARGGAAARAGTSGDSSGGSKGASVGAEEPTRYAWVHAVRFRSPHADVVSRAKMEDARKAYDAFVKGNGAKARMTVEGMQKIYEGGDFHAVKSLIENGAISKAHSLDMADLRTALILETSARICEENGWKLYRSDSGNQSAGMKSDIDQTIYVYKKEGNQWVRFEDGDAKFLDAFAKRFPEHAKMSLASLDVATIAGKDKFPDPRRTRVQLDGEGLRPFSAHAAETMESLRKTPGAYTYCGAVVQQMQLRAEKAIIDSLRADPTARGGAAPPREAHPMLAPMLGENGVNNLVCLEIGPGDDGGPVRPHEVSREQALRVMFDALPPSLLKGHAYDAAVANYLEFMHHVGEAHPAVKYHLRALDDGLRTLRRLKSQAPVPEFEALKTPEERRAHLEMLLGADPAMKPFVDRWQQAFEVSASLREAHKKGNLTDADYRRALEPLARELAGGDGKDWEKHVDRARTEYDARCQEFMLHNVVATSTDRVLEFVTHDPADPSTRPAMSTIVDEPRLRESLGLKGAEHDAKWESMKGDLFANHADLARLQLLYSFRELRPDVVDSILKAAKARGMTAPQEATLKGLISESKEFWFGWKRYQEFKPLYHAFAKAAVRQAFSQHVRRMQEHLLVQAGWIDTDAGHVPMKLLGEGHLGDYEARLHEFFRRNRAAGITSRYIRNAIFDFGNIVGLIQVVRAWSESGGDPEVTKEAMWREGLSALPVVGQIYNVYAAGSAAERARTVGIMVVCMLVPQAGVAALVMSLGEAGYSLYEHEVSKPLVDTVADAVYHGYVGPSLYSYEKEPPEFTKGDASSLASHQREIEKAKGSADPAIQKASVEHQREALLLRRKEAEWTSSEAEKRKRQTYEGSALFGTGAQWTQKVLDATTLLAHVEPVIFYAPSVDGPVDFTVKALSSDEEERLATLREKVDAGDADDSVALQDLVSERAALEDRKFASERAARYRAEASKNHELMHQIRRDSLWPFIAKMAPDRAMIDARAFVKDWVRAFGADVMANLKALGVTKAAEVPAAAIDELGARLLDDLERSRLLWNAHRLLGDAERKAEADRVERRKGAAFGEALADAARTPPVGALSPAVKAGLTAAGVPLEWGASLSPLAEAILARNIPEADAEIEIGLRKVPVDPKKTKKPAGGAGGADGAGSKGSTPGEPPIDEPQEWEFRPDVAIACDPEVFKPPYRAAAYQLDRAEIEAAIGAKTYKGLPLSDEMVKTLREHLKALGPADPEAKSVDPAVLTFVFCDGYERPKRVVAKTTEHLPALVKYAIPGQEASAYLMGGGAAAPSPTKIYEGEITARMRRGRRYGEAAIEVTSKALAKMGTSGDPATGLRFRVYRAGTADGKFEERSGHEYFVVRPDTPIWKPNTPDDLPPPGGCRLAPDRVAVWARISEEDTKKYGHVPLLFQVGQTAVVGKDDPKDKGEEARSEVVGPGTPEVVLYYENRDGEGRPAVRPQTSIGSMSLTLALGLAEQEFHAWDAHFVVKSGSWTGHAWSGRKEEERNVGGVGRGYAITNISIPIPARGGSVTVTGSGEGLDASVTFDVPMAPEALAQAEKNAAGDRADGEKRLAGIQQAIDIAKRTLDGYPFHRGEKFGPADAMYLQNHALAQHAYRSEAEVGAAVTRFIVERQNAYWTGDHAARVKACLKLIAAAKGYAAIDAEYVAAVEDAANSLESSAESYSTKAEDVAKIRKGLAAWRTSTRESRDSYLESLYRELMEYAYLAGDVKAFKGAHDARVRILEAYPSRVESLSSEYRLFAQPWATLSGDRQAAAEAWKKGHQIWAQAKPAEKATIEKLADGTHETWLPVGYR